MLASVILGSLAKQVKSGGLDLGGLTKILLDQKDNVAHAMPAGLMNSLSAAQGLGDLAGFAKSASGSVGSAARATGAAAAEAASPLRWLVPLVVVLAAAAGTYWFVNRPAPDATGADKTIENAVAQVGTVTNDFDDYFANMGTALTGVTDVDSAQAALPKLEGMATQLDTLGKALESLPAASRPALAETMATAVKQLESQRQRIEKIPGVGDMLKSILDRIFEKLAALLRQ